MGKKDRVFFDDKHHLNDEGIAICADALQLGKEDDLPQKVKSHLSECNACKQDLVNFYSIIENINQSSAEEHPFFSTNRQNKDDVQNRFNINKFFLTLAAALVVGISFISVYHWQGISNVSGPKDSPAFQNNPELENVLHDVYRSEEIEIIAPKINEHLHPPIRFEWKTEMEDSFKVIILNNKGKTLYTLKTHQMFLIFMAPLPPAVYYWKLENTEELLYVGKFYVEQD